MILDMVEQDNSALSLSDAQKAVIEKRLSESLDFVSDAEMHAFFRKLAG